MTVYEPPTAVTELINTITDDYKLYCEKIDIDDNSLSSYLTTIKDNIDFDLIIKTLDTCFCCERHQQNRPNKLEKYFETPFKNGGKITYPCNCKCRQISRFICRAEYGFCHKIEEVN
jgi:pyoverdine/dityrosine biosynthesis protein Dit1